MQQRLIPRVAIADLVSQARQLHVVNRQLYRQSKDSALLKEQFKVLEGQVKEGLEEYRQETSIEVRAQLKALKEVLQQEQALFHALPQRVSQQNTHCVPSDQESVSPQHLQLEELDLPDQEALHRREQDLEHIGGVIGQLKDIMQDQQHMVAQQGDSLLRVAAQIQSTDRNVDKAFLQVAQAHKRARSRRKLWCFLSLVFLLLLSGTMSWHLLIR